MLAAAHPVEDRHHRPLAVRRSPGRGEDHGGCPRVHVGGHGRVVAALGLSGPTSRLADLPTTGAHVVAQADALSTRLGPHRKKGAA